MILLPLLPQISRKNEAAVLRREEPAINPQVTLHQRTEGAGLEADLVHSHVRIKRTAAIVEGGVIRRPNDAEVRGTLPILTAQLDKAVRCHEVAPSTRHMVTATATIPHQAAVTQGPRPHAATAKKMANEVATIDRTPVPEKDAIVALTFSLVRKTGGEIEGALATMIGLAVGEGTRIAGIGLKHSQETKLCRS